MIKDNLNQLIMHSMKNHDNVKTEALRAIKTSILNWQSSKENIGKAYSEVVEISIIRKLVSQYEDTAMQCNDGKHEDLVKSATDTANVLKEFLPEPIDESTIQNFIVTTFKSDDLIKKNMGNLIKTIKEHYPAADGKMVSQVVMKNLN